MLAVRLIPRAALTVPTLRLSAVRLAVVLVASTLARVTEPGTSTSTSPPPVRLIGPEPVMDPDPAPAPVPPEA